MTTIGLMLITLVCTSPSRAANQFRVLQTAEGRITWTADRATVQFSGTTTEVTLYQDSEDKPEAGQEALALEGICSRTKNDLISIVGPVVSYQYKWESFCGAHPSYGASLLAVTLAKDFPPASIVDLFDEQEVLVALLQAKPIADKLQQRVHDLPTLLRTLGAPCKTDEYSKLLSSFAVLDVGRHLAVVRFAVRDVCGAGLGEFDVAIRITSHQDWFQAAQANGTLWMAQTFLPPDLEFREP
jgi:hypothetical protein